MKAAALFAGLAGLAACLISPVAHFRGSLDEEAMKALFLAGSIAWFAAAALWSTIRR